MLNSWIEKFARDNATMARFSFRRPAISLHLISPVPATSIDQPDHHKNLPKRERDLIFTKERCEEIAIDHLYD